MSLLHHGPRRAAGALLGVAALVLAAGATAAWGLQQTDYPDDVTGTTSTRPSTYPALEDSTTGAQLACTSARMGFTISPGDPVNGGITLGSVQSTTFADCIGPAGFQLTVTQQGTWNVQAVGGLSGGTGKIRLTQVRALATGNGCSLTVSGAASATINLNSKQVVVSPTGSTLSAANVSGCYGLVNNGDRVAMTATFVLE